MFILAMYMGVALFLLVIHITECDNRELLHDLAVIATCILWPIALITGHMTINMNGIHDK